MADDRVLLITGASRGIGAATARLAAAGGWTVAVNYASDAAAAERLVAEIESGGGRAVAIRADTADAAQVAALFAAVDATFGRLDGLVNNAGVLGPAMTLEALDGAQLQHILAVNVAGVFHCLREAARRMKAGGGAIVNLGSRQSELGGGGGFTAYAASKGAIDTLTVGAARELAPHDIRVNCVSPGVIDTEMHATTGIPDRAQRMVSQIPMGRVGGADEVAEAILWLLSDRASYVTGATIGVAGAR